MNNPSAKVTVMNSTSNHNGATGFQAFQLKNVLSQNVVASYNNWRGAQGAYYEWTRAALTYFPITAKPSPVLPLSIIRHSASTGTRTWLPSRQALSSPLRIAAVFWWKSAQGPVSVSNSTFCSTQGAGGSVTSDFVLRALSNRVSRKRNPSRKATRQHRPAARRMTNMRHVQLVDLTQHLFANRQKKS